jgi:putative ABC transport system permease protein
MPLPIRYNIRNLTVRKGSTLATALTIGLTVGVFLMVMSLARGIDLTLASSGERNNLIVVRNGATAELSSNVDRNSLDALKYLDGIEQENGEPLVSPELITLVYKARKGMTQGSNVTVRGVGPMATKLRSGFGISSGRMFQPGLTEAVVSKRIAERFQGMGLGDKFKVQATEYTVVGLFDAGGKAWESEAWIDVNSMQSATNRPSYTSVLVRVHDNQAMSDLSTRISDDQKLQLKAVSERKFYEDMEGPASSAMKGLGAFVSLIMAIGAAFAGMNTMYAAVSRRTKEIGTLRLLGFSRASILASFILESITISVLGVAIGILLALPLNFVSTGTSDFNRFAEIAFNFRVTPGLMIAALIFGAGIGLFGSALPSLRAARFKIVDALRAV